MACYCCTVTRYIRRLTGPNGGLFLQIRQCGILDLMRARASLTCILASFAAAGPAVAQEIPTALDRYLRDVVKFSAAEMADVQKGRAVSKLLPTENTRDVAVFGIVAVRTTPEAYLARAKTARQAVSARAASFGVFSDPVTPADVQGFSVDPSEVKDLGKCKPGDCDFKLPGSAMRDFAQLVDWKGSRAQAQVDSIVHQYMARFVTEYRAKGNAAMIRFDDHGGVEASDAFKALLTESPVLRDYDAPLQEYLLDYPAHRPDSVTQFIYWSDDRLPHLRPTFSITHVVIYTPATGLPVIARKQIYASHYFEGAFELLGAVAAPNMAGGPGTYLVSVRRFRFDNLPGGILNIRGRVSDALTKAMKDDLDRERTASEAHSR